MILLIRYLPNSFVTNAKLAQLVEQLIRNQ